MRLNKYIAKAGIASRRRADLLLQQGRIAVNGRIITELGAVVDESVDEVTYDGRPVTIPDEYTYLILNKPTGYLVTCKDDYGRPIVLDLVGKHRGVVRPVGRLDLDSSGLLLFTNNGELAYRLTHPRYEIDKKYEIKCEGFISNDVIEKLRSGVDLQDGKTSPAGLELISRSGGFSRFYITIHEGRKRQIRRMCVALGHKVITLVRVAFGDIALGDLKDGKYRLLTEDEISYLKKTVGL